MGNGKPIIAIAPIKYFDINSTHNLFKIRKYIRLAKRSNADVVCFPESCLKKGGSIELNNRLILTVQEECRKNSIWCVITEDIQIKEKVYNMSLLIDRKGRIKGKYKKIYLYGDKVEPGNRVEVFRTDFGKVGLAICWDLSHPDIFAAMKEKGAEIVFCPAQWNYDLPAHKNRHRQREIALLRSLIQARAHENVFYLALCNPLRADSRRLVSYSAIADPHKIIKESIDQEGLMTTEVDLGELEKFRKFYS